MKPTLSIEEIQFIDTYLKNSDVRFADIRMEMVDHVASEIESRMEEREEDFGKAFLGYMALNKNTLIKNSRKYYLCSDKKLLGQLFKNIFSINGGMIVLGSYFATKTLWGLVGPDYVVKLPFLLSIVIPLLYVVDYSVYKKRYSYLERVCLYFAIYLNISNLIFEPFGLDSLANSGMDGQNIFKISLGVALPLLLLQLGFQNYQFYKKKYQTIS